MITLKELCAYSDALLPSLGITDYCINGLQIEGDSKIERLATGVSASLATIKAAIDFGAKALIVHHGIFWSGDNYAITGSKKEKIKLLMDHGISLLAYHLPLDMHENLGNNWKAAKDMGWTDLKPFGFSKGIAIGVQGNLHNIGVDSFQKSLENYYLHPAHVALGGKKQIQTAALISGGAHKSITEATTAGIDCFITGSFDEPTWHQAFEEKINFFALGHSATERVGPQALGDHLSKHFNLQYKFLDIPNPF